MTNFPVDGLVDNARKVATVFSGSGDVDSRFSGQICGYAQGYAPLVTGKCLLINEKISLRGEK